jgi:acyl carrier protein
MTPRFEETGNNSRDLEHTLTRLVSTTLGKSKKRLQPNALLISSSSDFDSFSLWELILRIEETFGIEIPDDDFDPSNFHSIATIASYLRCRLEQE